MIIRRKFFYIGQRDIDELQILGVSIIRVIKKKYKKLGHLLCFTPGVMYEFDPQMIVLGCNFGGQSGQCCRLFPQNFFEFHVSDYSFEKFNVE